MREERSIDAAASSNVAGMPELRGARERSMFANVRGCQHRNVEQRVSDNICA